MLNTPTSVDSLPRLRRFTPSQTQISSFAYLGHDEGPRGSKSQEAKDNKENTEDKDETVAKKSAGTPPPSANEAAKDKEDERQEEKKQAQSKGEVKQTRSSQVLCQPVSEIQGTTDNGVKGDPQDRRDLVKSGLKSPGGQEMTGEADGDGEGEGEARGDPYGDDQKMCCGFFFKVSRIICGIIFIVT